MEIQRAAAQTKTGRVPILSRHRSIPHLGRKFYHFLMGMVCFSLYGFVLTREQALFILSVIGGTWVILDLARLRFMAVNRLALRMFGALMRREELKSISGNSFYILGLLFIVLLFPKPIVLLSVLFLAVGDPIAALVGTHWGQHRLIGKKSVEGALANLVASGFAAYFFGVLYLHQFPGEALLLGLIGGICSMVAELVPAPVDDNFTIPAFSAVLLSVLGHFFAIF